LLQQGGVPVHVGAVGNPFGWKGHRVDGETGLVYMRNRYYHTGWGRFLTQDPLGVWGDDLVLGNDYCYGANSPLVLEDRMGLQIAGFIAKNLAKVGIKKLAKTIAKEISETITKKILTKGVKRRLKCLDEINDKVESYVGLLDGGWGDFFFELIPYVGDAAGVARTWDAWKKIEKKLEKLDKAVKKAKINGLLDSIAEHEKKLEDYIRDPLGNDHLGKLKAALDAGDKALYKKIYDGRVENLNKQIETFEKDISLKIEEALKELGDD
jgi:RHS repeat-associated protein